MADDTQQTKKSATTQVKKPASDQPNPLDVLEKLLDEIDEGKGAGTSSSKDLVKKQAAGKAPTGPTPEEIAAKKLEEQRLEYEKIKAEQQIIDQQKIEEQRVALVSEMETGEANIARAHQDEEKAEKAKKLDQDDDGFEVIQLDHTKI